MHDRARKRRGFIVLIGVCVIALLAVQAAEKTETAAKLHTAYNLWYEQPDKIYSTGYQKGVLIPAGTEVSGVDQGGRSVEFTDVKTQVVYKLLWVPKHHPGLSFEQFCDRLFTPKDFAALTEGFTPAEVEAIRQGKVVVGMSKKSVLVAYGYPPEVNNPSLEADSWKYNRDRFVQTFVRFSDGKVTETGR